MITKKDLKLMMFYTYRGLHDANAEKEHRSIYDKIQQAIDEGKVQYIE